MRRVLAVLLMAATAPAFGAEPLGRLFFTPAERAQLDQARLQKERPPVAKAAEAPAPAPPAPQILTYSGVIRRSDGKAVLWLNDRPVDEKDASGLAVAGRIRDDGSVTVRVPGRTIDLKVGQSVELTSGTVAERKSQALVTTPPRTPKASPAPEPAERPAAEKEKDQAPAAAAPDERRPSSR